ncbi:MAG TPA: response regulator transcription factor [Ktedonobacteraceae bacterium]|nr:response regulator transcription factor [Ktedonobacteraceae bacterium]
MVSVRPVAAMDVLAVDDWSSSGKRWQYDGEPSRITQEERSLPMIKASSRDDHELAPSTYMHRSKAMKILVADHDRDLVDLLSFWLKRQRYDVVRAFDGEQAILRWHEAWPDLVLLDLYLPKRDGFVVCQQMRSETPEQALILTGSACEEDEVRGLELGADACLRKPFSPRRLLAHITAVLRRASHAHPAAASPMIAGGPIALDPLHHEVLHGERKVKVTPTESRLLHVLMTHPGQVLTPGIISKRVWGHAEEGNSGLIKTHLHHLRQKVELDAKSPRYILTVPGRGYTFTVPAERRTTGWIHQQQHRGP